MESVLLDGFAKQGVLGLVVIALGLAVWRMFSLYAAAQEKRILEARETIKTMEDNTNAIEALTRLIEERVKV